jgi:pyruvate kinase
MHRRTKIVATVGPASANRLGELIDAGVDIFRLNLSHGELADHLIRLRDIRAAAAERGKFVGVLADLPGPKIRSGQFPEGGAMLLSGQRVVLVEGEDPSTGERISVDYPGLARDVRPGDRVVLGDGAIEMLVDEVVLGEIHARITSGGQAQGRPGVHLPAERSTLTAPTEEDLELVAAVVAADVDFIAVSFVRDRDDLERVIEAVEAASPDGRRPMLVAKIETAPAVANLYSILQVADVVMVARGDLGIECPLEDLPHLQKQVIRACMASGVPVITATQMLESMITSPAPTRAEVTDIANAVIDGTDAVMLSGETAIGHDPVLVVETMARIAVRAEESNDDRHLSSRLSRSRPIGQQAGRDDITMATTHAACQTASEVGAAAIVCTTRQGRSARSAARFRPGCRLIALSPSERVLRQLSVSWGVHAIHVAEHTTTDELVWFAVKATVEAGLAPLGSLVVVLAGAPDRPEDGASVLRVVRLK